MGTKLQCEICGGKLVGKPGGIFECENCGTEFSTEWAKAKIQEISGTVKVEGTVEVQGSVKVHGAVSAESLIKRGNLLLEDSAWYDATVIFNEALKADTENAEAYLGLAMVGLHCRDRKAFAAKYVKPSLNIHENKNIERAKRFAQGATKEWLAELDRKREKGFMQGKKDNLEAKKKKDALRAMLATGDGAVFGLKSNGTVVAVGSNIYGQCNVSGWQDIIAIAAGRNHVVGLKSDGTVVAAGMNNERQCGVSDWTDIVKIAAGWEHTVGLKSDGTLVATGKNDEQQCEVSDWKDIEKIAADWRYTAGIKSDGTVVIKGEDTNISYDTISEWTEIEEITANGGAIAAVRSDGTVVVNGDTVLECDIEDWDEIVKVAVSEFCLVGLKANGTVIAEGTVSMDDNNAVTDNFGPISKWKNIIDVAVMDYGPIIALRSDGKVLCFGNYLKEVTCELANWKLIITEKELEADYLAACAAQESATEGKLTEAMKLFAGMKDYKDSAKREEDCRKAYEEAKAAREARECTEREARERAEREAKRTELTAEKEKLAAELPTLKGLFSSGKRKQIEARLAEIDSELAKL